VTRSTPVRRSDDEIRRDVLRELEWDSQVQLNDTGVSVRDGVATLTGWVDNCVEAQAAERAAHRVRGVRAVVSDIEVRIPDSAVHADAVLAAKARQVLDWDVKLPVGEPQVTVSNGWVTLRGEVDWDHQRRAAEHAVRRLTGVRGITNRITVLPLRKPSAEELEARIEEAVARTCEAGPEPITVDVHDGTVTLAGTVCAQCVKETANLVAWLAPGINAVDNRIAVSPHAD
jgi:osmotically-inducible protein OsmY